MFGGSARSTARTRSVCSPASRPVRSCGVSHELKSAPSSAHSNVAFGSSEANVKIAGASGRIAAAGPDSIVVSGGVMSTMENSHSAGSASTSRNGLVGSTVNV